MTGVFGRDVRMYAGPRDRPALDQAFGADGVARIEHRDVRLRAHHRQILERHLRRTVLANRDAGVMPAILMLTSLIAAIRMKS